MVDDSRGGWKDLLDSALAVGASTIPGSDGFDRACDHVYGLLRDATLLLRSRSHASSFFLSVTALEETVKVAVGMYRTSTDDVKRGADPLYRHRDKHHLAASPTILMGTRLGDAIGRDRVVEIFEQARTGRLVALREASLYFASMDQSVRIPSEEVTVQQARDLLLFALEAFGDALVGYTNHSLELGEAADDLFMQAKDAG